MGKLFTRIKNSILADVHDMLDQKEEKNPIGMLNVYIRQCEQEVEKVRKLVNRQYRLKDEFTREYRQALELAAKRQHQMEIANKAGVDDLLEFVSQEQEQYQQRAETLKMSLDKVNEQLDQLERRYEEMKHKLKDMKIKRLELMGRENIARAHSRINKVLDTNSGLDQAKTYFEEMEEHINRIEHRVNSAYYRNTVDARIAQLEKELQNKENHTPA